MKASHNWVPAACLVGSNPDDNELETTARTTFCSNHRNFKRIWLFPDPFPDAEVISAYQNPVVDASLRNVAENATLWDWKTSVGKHLPGTGEPWAKLCDPWRRPKCPDRDAKVKHDSSPFKPGRWVRFNSWPTGWVDTAGV
eukprot:Plantae.Rhodophyta-Rhodochaete_pulchella.ctg25182.p1 GENE.Plantae.Rhodophyta-Rhodochaete_pulchella.ctg25182~~Plantae.Rhodophyta-Rhodochaete_pulchella.ctg25182.p1  ORF type:complete len:141 (+),score=8.76 Plantae.Rhodophyta-Rhodochaete_pulchella.ctg25182:597-1019(+)